MNDHKRYAAETHHCNTESKMFPPYQILWQALIEQPWRYDRTDKYA